MSDRYLQWVYPGEVPDYEKVEPVESDTVWWCKTHGIGQHYDGKDPWWDEYSPYVCAFKAEYPVDGDCVPIQVAIVRLDDE